MKRVTSMVPLVFLLVHSIHTKKLKPLRYPSACGLISGGYIQSDLKSIFLSTSPNNSEGLRRSHSSKSPATASYWTRPLLMDINYLLFYIHGLYYLGHSLPSPPYLLPPDWQLIQKLEIFFPFAVILSLIPTNDLWVYCTLLPYLHNLNFKSVLSLFLYFTLQSYLFYF